MVEFVVICVLLFLFDRWHKKWVKSKEGQKFPEIENKLISLADSLKLDHEFDRVKNAVVHIIIEEIKREGNRRHLQIGRTKIAGSIGKGTGITYINDGEKIYPDLDLVVYINDAEPPFDEELVVLKEILEVIIEVSELSVRKGSLQFYFDTKYYGKIKIDLLPAENYVVYTQQLCDQEIGEMQARHTTHELIRKQEIAIKKSQIVSQKENKLRSSSLAEITVKKLRDAITDDYILNVVRLAKYWNSKIDLSDCGYVPARSCIIELIAITTLKTKFQYRKDRPSTLCYGFKLFLQAMTDFRDLDVRLENNEYLPNEIKQYSLPMIRDPANMLNNFAEGVPVKAAETWEEQARKSLKLLKKEIYKDPTDLSNIRFFGNAIDDIFSHKYSSWPNIIALILILIQLNSSYKV